MSISGGPRRASLSCLPGREKKKIAAVTSERTKSEKMARSETMKRKVGRGALARRGGEAAGDKKVG